MRAQYWAMIALIDYEVGRILGALEISGLAANTHVVFTFDHGGMLGNQQQHLKGPRLYDDLTNVPLISRWSEHTPTDTNIANLVQCIDLPSTFLMPLNARLVRMFKDIRFCLSSKARATSKTGKVGASMNIGIRAS